jgi:dephospho-CoA kinase
MKKLFFITGASGVGKTTTIKNIQKDNKDIAFFYFDSLGVPSQEDRKKYFGGGEEWQRITTSKWVKKIKEEVLDDVIAVLDGQMRPSFIDQACMEEGIENYEVILLDCNDEERFKRLINRGSERLATTDTINFAEYLRNESIARGYTIIDNSIYSMEEISIVLSQILLR